MKSIQNPTVCIKSFKSTTICFSMVDLLCKFLIPTEINLFYIFHNNNNKAVFPGCNFSFMVRQCYARGKDEGINNTELNSVITIITHLEGVFLCVLCFAVQILVNKLRILRQGKGDPHIKRYFFVLISHSYFFVFQIQCFCFLSFVYVFSLQQTKRIRKNKPNRTKKRRHHIAKFSGW